METRVITLRLLFKKNIYFYIAYRMLKKCLVHLKLGDRLWQDFFGFCKTIQYKSHLFALSVSELGSHHELGVSGPPVSQNGFIAECTTFLSTW